MLRPAAHVLLAMAAFAAGCTSREPVLTAAVALLPGELPAYRAVVAGFERETGIRVVVVPQQYADIRRALAGEALGGGGSLDLVELDVYSLAAAARDVAVLDEGALAATTDALEPAVLEAGRIDGLRFLPHRVAWQALLYDHDVLGAPPSTWDELLEVARAHSGRIGLKGARYEGLTCDVLPFVWAAGGSGDVLDDGGAAAAFEFFRELAPHLHPQSAIFKEATIAEAMARGEIVLHLNWPFAMSLFASQGLAPGRIRSARLPRGPAGTATVLGGGYLAVPIGSRRRGDAVRLASYLLGDRAQRRLAAELGWFSPRRDLPPAAAGDLLEGFAAARDDVRPRPERRDYPRLSRAWQGAFRDVVFGGAEPAETLREAQRRFARSPGE
jgi:multiple sugar transport system substrate-binding protein